MAKQWTNKKLSKLAETVSQFASQLELLQEQVSQMNQTVAYSSGRIDTLIQVLAGQSDLPSDPAIRTEAVVESDRLEAITTQVQQLNYRLQILERRELSQAAVGLLESIEDEEIEDEPDEVLWDFIEPGASSSR